MPSNKNDVIRGPYSSKPIYALGGDDKIYWGPASGSGIVYGGDTGEHYDPDPYHNGNPGGDRLYLTGKQGITVRFITTESGVATGGGESLKFFGIERLHGSAGNDIINAARATLAPAHDGTPQHGLSIYAGAGNDRITGTAFADVLDGGSGNDTIFGGAGDDFIQSSTGDDLIYGGAGNDNIRWGLGDNVAPGNDTIYGGNTQEGIGDLINIWVVNGDQRTGAHVRFTTAEDGVATSTMGGRTNTLHFYDFENGWTHRGNDTIDASGAKIGANMHGVNFSARWGDDILIGSRGNDTLQGGEGRDTITGGKGNDLISANGEAYNWRAPGDGVADTLIFHRGDGADTVLGFDVGIDILQVDGRSYSVSQTARGTLLDFGHGDSILLSNIFDFT
ncbi:calcium-binding protein [Paracoccus aminophilus]|uniref:Calcium-binding protein n=1 Tax=Paracoccus aminophilus JCM 7686 TaxID=1367847 RepID=S5XUU8_PARAH|nr:calcium-binding protein [Paracoccus aminophilus]AGT11284.1 hypothetical protein JCM7686_pAMI5p218 [Paracoccus aminophilus JCM 7686]